jgi:hypothetical protein
MIIFDRVAENRSMENMACRRCGEYDGKEWKCCQPRINAGNVPRDWRDLLDDH